MISLIGEVMALARKLGDYRLFREAFYEKHLRSVICDSRETIPATLAIFYLSHGDPEKCILNGANFGRDADTIASMTGAIAGACCGVQGLPHSWVAQIEAGGLAQKEMAGRLTGLIRERMVKSREIGDILSAM